MNKSIRDIIKDLEYLKPIQEAADRAKDLTAFIPKGNLYIGISGIELDFDYYQIRDYLSIRKVINPPGVVHVCSAGCSNSDYFGVGRYSSSIKAELIIGEKGIDLGEYKKTFFELAWHFVALIKLQGFTSLFCPVAATSSWDIIAAISDKSVSFFMLDDVPKQLIYSGSLFKVTTKDVEWIINNWEKALNLRDREVSRRFGLAFNIAYTWNQTNDFRIAIANLWCGIEALFGCQSDNKVTDSLAERISDWLPAISKTSVKKLYKQRCDAVHGRNMDEAKIRKAIINSEYILRSSLIKSIENTKATLPDWS